MKEMGARTTFGVCSFCAALVFAGCQGIDQTISGFNTAAVDRLESHTWDTVSRLHSFQGIYLASQPQPKGFKRAKKAGVKTVINLRHEEEVKAFNERELVSSQGLIYISLPWNGVDQLNDTVFERTRELLNSAQRPILLHCSSGNRVGAVWLPWRVLDGKATYEEALTEAKAIGL